MRLGISSYTYGWAVGTEGNRPPVAIGAIDLIRRAKAFGVRVLQLCDNLPAETWEPDSVGRLAAEARSAGVSLEVGTRGTSPEHLRRLLEISRHLGSNILRIVVDTAGDQPSPDEVIRRLAEVVPDLRSSAVTVGIENHDRFKSQSLAHVVRKLATPHVGICLDTVNSFGALEGPRVVVETLGPYCVNLHLKDFAVARFPHLQGFTIEGRPAGQGMLDIPWMLGRLREFGRDPNAILELWTPPEATAEETIHKEAEWARLSVDAARQWIKE